MFAPCHCQKEIVERYRLKTSNDFRHRPIACTPAGDGGHLVLHSVYYIYRRYDEPDSGPEQDPSAYNAYFISKIGPDGSHVWTREIDWLAGRVHEELLDRDGVRHMGDYQSQSVDLCRTGPNAVALLTSLNRVFVLDDDLELRQEWAKGYYRDHERLAAADVYVAQLDVLDDGRWLGVVGEEVGGPKSRPNLVGVSDPNPSWSTGRPALHYRTTLHATSRNYSKWQERGAYPHLLMDGVVFDRSQRDAPTLGDRLHESWSLTAHHARALSSELLVASYFEDIPRSRYVGILECDWAIARPDGELVSVLDKATVGDHHPFAPTDWPHTSFFPNRRTRTVVVKVRDAFFHFGVEGLLHRTPLDKNPAHKAFRHAHLVQTNSGGGLVLFHPKHHTLILVDPFDSPERWPEVLGDAIAGYAKARKRWLGADGLQAAHNRWLCPAWRAPG